jgi:hypothetical protein
MRALLVLLLGLLLSSCAVAEPDFLYYTTAECGNDYFTRCVVEGQAKGAKFSVFHGFMKSPLVETGELTQAEWDNFQKTVLAEAKKVPASKERVFNVDHFNAPKLERKGPCPEALKAAFAKTKPGRSFHKWLGKH